MKNTLFLGVTVLAALAGISACDNTTELNIGSVGETMAFDNTSLEAKAGSKVTLTMKNNATSPAMQHDWVLVKPGTDAAVSVAAMKAAPTYIPSSPDIIAHTKLLKPGESDTITFTAPSTPGDYPFLCTFPGHYPLMKGTLKID